MLRDELLGRRVWVIGSDRAYQWDELSIATYGGRSMKLGVAKLQSEDTARLFRLDP